MSVDGVPIPKVDPILQALEKRLVVGSTVRELDEGYALYCEYGRIKGFGVRRGIQKYAGRSNDLKWKEFVCSCAGFPDGKRPDRRVPRYKLPITRSDCKAKIRFSRAKGSMWHTNRFEYEHNHELIPADQTYLLRSYRNLSNANIAILEALHESRIGISGACGFMEKQSRGSENLGFLRRDAYNHFVRKNRMSKLKDSDSKQLLDYFTSKSNEEPFFFWKAETDNEGRLMNFFFRDMRCAEDYECFGDVLSIDTTYRTNKYSLVCAPFVGINHHTFTVMFGMGFLSNETSDSFEWLFKVFLDSMKGAQPKVIFTDQCMATMKAIDKMFPNSKHRLCQWHINRNAVKRFGSLNGNATFKRCWYRCLNNVDTEEEFEAVWKELLSYTKPSTKKRTWYTTMYDLRHRWASVFSRGIFTACLLVTSHSEGTNRCLKCVQACTDTLIQFVCNYESMKTRWRKREKEEDTLGNWLPGQLVSNNELFTQAALRYTRNVYKLWEYEATKSFDVIVSHEHKDLGDGVLEITTQPADKIAYLDRCVEEG